MVEHSLKIEKRFIPRILSGQKTFEIRKNDRDYQVGDILRLYEFNPEHKIQWSYEGRVHNLTVEVVYMSSFAQQDGYVVLGIKPKTDSKVEP